MGDAGPRTKPAFSNHVGVGALVPVDAYFEKDDSSSHHARGQPNLAISPSGTPPPLPVAEEEVLPAEVGADEGWQYAAQDVLWQDAAMGLTTLAPPSHPPLSLPDSPGYELEVAHTPTDLELQMERVGFDSVSMSLYGCINVGYLQRFESDCGGLDADRGIQHWLDFAGRVWLRPRRVCVRHFVVALPLRQRNILATQAD